MGNLPIILVPAMCKERSSPFGAPEVCEKYGLAYASLSMAVRNFSLSKFQFTFRYLELGYVDSKRILIVSMTLLC